jgi:hypothetical protein
VNPDWLVTLSPIFGLAVNVGLQLALVHSTHRIGLSIIGGACGGLVAALIDATVNLPSHTSMSGTLAVWSFVVLAYLALAFDYWVFLNLNITSLRIRTLRDLLNHNGGISRADLMAQYSLEEVLHRRLLRLEHGKQIVFSDGKWKLISGKLMIFHYLLATMRAVIMPSRAKNATPE